jgi:hypothetical protein
MGSVRWGAAIIGVDTKKGPGAKAGAETMATLYFGHGLEREAGTGR